MRRDPIQISESPGRGFEKASDISVRLCALREIFGKPYLRVIAKKAGHAIHVLDRFHICTHLSKASDQIRASEARQLRARGLQRVLKRTRWCLLKRPENLTPNQSTTLAELLRYNLKTVRAYLLKENLQFFWNYISPHWAGKFLDKWCTQVMRSRIEPMKRVARMLRAHRELILNWFRTRKTISAGSVEGLNNKAKLTTRKAYGFRSFRTIEIALYHTLGKLPEPNFTQRYLLTWQSQNQRAVATPPPSSDL